MYLSTHHRFFMHVFQSSNQTITLINQENKKPLFESGFL